MNIKIILYNQGIFFFDFLKKNSSTGAQLFYLPLTALTEKNQQLNILNFLDELNTFDLVHQ